MIQVSDILVNVEWSLHDGTRFTSLGIQDKTGNPKFESQMYFTHTNIVIEPESDISAKQEMGPFELISKNGFGTTCEILRWTVVIQTDKCIITNPEPYIVITANEAHCWFGDQKVAKGSAKFCQPNEDCDCCSIHDKIRSEDCIQWVVQRLVATGFYNIKVEGGVKAEVSGVEVDVKLTMEAGRIGAKLEKEVVGVLCAKSGAKSLTGYP